MYVRFVHGRSIDITVKSTWQIPADMWDNVGQRFKPRLKYNNVFTEQRKLDLETDLSRVRDYILNEHIKLAMSGKVATKAWLSDAINHAINGGPTKGAVRLNEYIDQFIKQAESGRILSKNGVEYAKATIKAYKSFQTQFNRYQEERGRILEYDDITLALYQDFLSFFNSKDYSPNTVGKLVKILKIFMKATRELGYHSNFETERKGFKTITRLTQDIYLTEEELRKLYNLDLSKNKSHEAARDVFLIGCYTAQRYSDYSRIRYEDIKDYHGIKAIELTQKKTGERVLIPCRPELIAILSRHKDKPLKTWEQKVNKYIKEVGQEAGITDPISVVTKKDGITQTEYLPKCKLIKTHTARRTGCTLMYLAKDERGNSMSPIDIMKISGHKTEREFLKYVKVGQEETAMRLASHTWFTGKTSTNKKKNRKS